MNKKNIIIIIPAIVALIVAGYFIFNYFKGGSGANVSQTSPAADSQNLDNGIFAPQQESSSNNSNSLNLNLSDNSFSGKGINETIAILENLNLGIEFFADEKFIKLVDFSKKVEVREEEKGNFNPFKAIGSIQVNLVDKNATSTKLR